MNRRGFHKLALGTSIIAASAFIPYVPYTDPLIIRRRPSTPKTSRNVFTCPAAIEPITGYLARTALPAIGVPPPSFVATYNIINWGEILVSTKLPRNAVVGKLIIQRRAGAKRVVYTVDEARFTVTGQLIYQQQTRYWALPESENVTRWELTFLKYNTSGKAIPLVGYKEFGIVNYTSGIRVKRSCGTSITIGSYEHPIIHQASMIAGTILASSVTPSLFSMAHEGMMIRERQ